MLCGSTDVSMVPGHGSKSVSFDLFGGMGDMWPLPAQGHRQGTLLLAEAPNGGIPEEHPERTLFLIAGF
jgi:hypothetical protein